MEIIDDELGVKLHHLTTTGGTLSEEERAQLQAWYDEKDREEAEMLRANRRPLIDQDLLDEQIAGLHELLAQIVRQNQRIANQNDALLAEIANLRSHLANQKVPQPA